jgi:hypothetical protein
VVPSALVDPSTGAPLVSDSYVTADTALRAKLIRNAVREDLIGRWGGGGYAICTGLAISIGTGLLLNVSAGQAMIDGPRTVPADTTVAVMDGITRAYVYLSQSGVLSVVNNSLVVPAGAQVFLGSCVTAGGIVTSVDTSGVLYKRGGWLVRQTFDSSCPSDSPPAGLTFINEGAAGAWIWDGFKYLWVYGGRAALTFSSDANKTLTTPEATNAMIDFGSGGTALTATRDVIMPLEGGREWTVRNGSNGGQSLRFIGASGTGITVATAKIQRLFSDGTNILASAAAV